MLQRYQGFYLDKGQRIPWDASASATLYGVRHINHRKPRPIPGRELIRMPDFWLVVAPGTKNFRIGHARAYEPSANGLREARIVFWSTLSEHLIEQHGIAIKEENGESWGSIRGRHLTLSRGWTIERYFELSALVGEEPWI